jgi:hypothetical protein
MKCNKAYETFIGDDMFEYFELYDRMRKKYRKMVKEIIKDEGCCGVFVTLHDGEELVDDQYYGGITFEIEFPDKTYKIKTEPFHCNSPMGITFFYNIGQDINETYEEDDDDSD